MNADKKNGLPAGMEGGNNRVYIAGAHSRARTLKAYFACLFPDVKVEAFLVDDMSENEPEADGIPVRLISTDLDTNHRVYIGTRGVNHPKMKAELEQAGFTEIIPVTVELDRELRNAYVRELYRKQGREFVMLEELDAKDTADHATARIYVAGSVHDGQLHETYCLTEDEALLQVGAALTDRRLQDSVLTDCTGDNISVKNRQYCELTGLYWIWKNAKEDYVGLAHYRRHFLLPEKWTARMEKNHIDAVLPVPLYVAPSVEGNYRGRHDASDWDFMMHYLNENLPDEYEKAKAVFAGNLYCPCNMLIARKAVLEEVCSFVFPIVDAAVEHGGGKEDAYFNRYPGFLSERLITYFFESRRDRYRVAYADKNFLA